MVLNVKSVSQLPLAATIQFNIEAEIKKLCMHEQYALRDDQKTANALLEKWCMNPDLCYFLSEELKFKTRLNRPSSEPRMFDYDDSTENHVPSDLQLEKLCLGAPVQKTMHRDFVVERRLLIDY